MFTISGRTMHANFNSTGLTGLEILAAGSYEKGTLTRFIEAAAGSPFGYKQPAISLQVFQSPQLPL